MNTNVQIRQRVKNRRILQNPSDEAILSVVVLGLVAAVSDGTPDNNEIQSLRNNISKLYLKDSSDVLPFIEIALKCIKIVILYA